MPYSDIRHDPRWAFLNAAQRLLRVRLSKHGVDQIRFVAAPQDPFAVWLCTRTDRDRDVLGTLDPLLGEMRSILVEVGFTASQVADLHPVAQSQETVDRDYESSFDIVACNIGM
jgi:hypothetical protein